MRKRSGPAYGLIKKCETAPHKVCGKNDKMRSGAVSLEEYTARAHLLIAK
jgi:hypothetical protein